MKKTEVRAPKAGKLTSKHVWLPTLRSEIGGGIFLSVVNYCHMATAPFPDSRGATKMNLPGVSVSLACSYLMEESAI